MTYCPHAPGGDCYECQAEPGDYCPARPVANLNDKKKPPTVGAVEGGRSTVLGDRSTTKNPSTVCAVEGKRSSPHGAGSTPMKVGIPTFIGNPQALGRRGVMGSDCIGGLGSRTVEEKKPAAAPCGVVMTTPCDRLCCSCAGFPEVCTSYREARSKGYASLLGMVRPCPPMFTGKDSCVGCPNLRAEVTP